MSVRFISFFSGALGLDLGLEQAGFRCLAANEIEPRACETIRLNRPRLNLYDCDIRELSAEGILRDLRLSYGDIDLVAGGPPCQAFSTAGKRRSLDDDRGNLVLHFLNVALSLNPQWIVLENVRGLLSAPIRHRPHNLRGGKNPALRADELPGGALARVITILEDAGFGATFCLYDAANFGVPQRRERLILIANRDAEAVPYLAPTHSQDDWVTFKEAVAGLPRKHEYIELRESQLKYLEYIGSGENWRALPKRLQKAAMGKAFLASGGRVGFYRRVAWNAPSPTLVTSPTMPATLLAHPEKFRPLSVEEYKRLQGFPDSWELSGSTTQKYRQLGNAVPVGLAKHLGRHLLHGPKKNSEALTTSKFATSRYSFTSDREWRRQYAAAIERSRELCLAE